jgi:hypothetical protein
MRMCEELELIPGAQRCILLVDCWWGWLDAEFREWLKREHPYVLILFVPACCTPVGQPNDAGIIAILKGEHFILNSHFQILTQSIAGNLRLLYGIFVSTFTQEKLKNGQDVILPINETVVMKAKLAEWISESVKVMNEKKQEKVKHCWNKTGILAIWDVHERSMLTPQAFQEVARLFPSHDIADTSGVANETDDLEQFDDFSSAVATKVHVATGEVTSKEGEEDAEVEEELVAAVVSYAQSSGICEDAESGPNETADVGDEVDAHGMQWIALICLIHNNFAFVWTCRKDWGSDGEIKWQSS